MIRHSFKASDGVTLYVEHYPVLDDAQSAIIFWSHGFTGSARNWRSTVRRLPGFSHVVYDLRGHARSDVPDNEKQITLERLALDLIELIQFFSRSDQHVYCVGLSLGAVIVQQAVVNHAQLIDAVVLSSLPDPLARGSISGQALDFATAIEAKGLESAGRQFVWGESSGFSVRDAELVKQGFLEHSPVSVCAFLRNVLSQLPSSESFAMSLSHCAIPVLFLAGDRDQAARDFTRKVFAHHSIARQNDAYKCELIEGGHLLNLTSASTFCDRLTRFFNGVD